MRMSWAGRGRGSRRCWPRAGFRAGHLRGRLRSRSVPDLSSARFWFSCVSDRLLGRGDSWRFPTARSRRCFRRCCVRCLAPLAFASLQFSCLRFAPLVTLCFPLQDQRVAARHLPRTLRLVALNQRKDGFRNSLHLPRQPPLNCHSCSCKGQQHRARHRRDRTS